ncbi:MAG: hypothetical protein ACOYL5_16895 [Phototrophicaceae bacterium]
MSEHPITPNDENIILPLEDKPKRTTPTRLSREIWIIVHTLLMMPLFCCGAFIWTAYGSNIIGTVTEFFTHYRPSQVVYVDYSSCGSAEIQFKYYVRWTADDIERIATYYQRIGNPHDVDLRPVDESRTTGIICSSYMHEERNRAALDALPDYGTLIITYHDYWAG